MHYGIEATLDLLSGGRVVFGVGLGGVQEEFSAFGEPADAGASLSVYIQRLSQPRLP